MDQAIPYLFNGQADSQIPASLRALHYGDGLFETLRWQRRAVLFELHMQRLQRDCQRLAIPFPDPQLLLNECQRLADGVDRAVIKIILSRGAHLRGYAFDPHRPADRLLLRYDFPAYPPQIWRLGIKARLCSTRLARDPALAGMKHLNRLHQILARAEWQDPEIIEGFMMDDKGLLVEACQSNVFLVKNGELYTPALEQCGVAGVMRQCVIDSAARLKIPLKIVDLPIDRLYQADEVFVTNSVIGVWPVTHIDEKQFAVGPISLTLQTAIDKLMENQ